MSRMLAGRPMTVGVDGTEAARRAARWAAEEAVRRGVGLRLVHAVRAAAMSYPEGYVPPRGFFDALEVEARGLLDDARADVHSCYPALEVQLELCIAHPVAALVGESERAGVVVLGGRERGGVEGLLAGSTAVSVAAHARSPVAVIRGSGGPNLPVSGPVVVGVDGSPASEAAVAFAFDEASMRRVELVAVHTWTEFASDADYIYARQAIWDWEPIEAEQRAMLAERLAGWQEKYPDVSVRRVVARGKPARALLSVAADAALLVVGSRGRGGFAGMLLGSVSRKLIHHATCPLVIARSTSVG
jgi:nucleotide-binding universal stress UspA family protein